MAPCSMSSGGMGSMSMGAKACNHHIEIHIVNRRTGKVVTHARVTLSLTNTHMHSVINVPIMTMVGANEGMGDFHYGNNIYAPTGVYTVSARVNSTKASFAVTLK